MKNFKFWTKVSAVFMLLTGIFHSISLFVSSAPRNETERQLDDLVTNYRIDAGAGFHPSYSNLFTALSSCFTLLCLLGGITLFYLLRKRTADETVAGIININLVIFGICFAMMGYFTFLPPIVCTALIFVSLLAARFTVPSNR